MESIILTGGSTNQSVRIGDVVHKSANEGNPIMVREYLQFLEKEGMEGVPRFLGVDEQGREMFSYLPGKTMGPDYPHDHQCLHSDQAVCDMALFLKKLHDTSVGFLPRAMEAGWKNPYFPDGPYETICHGDTGIWNFVFVNDRVAGLFDFEQAYPGTRIWDITSTLSMSAFPVPYNYDSKKQAGDTKRKVALFFEAYGMACPTNFMDIVVDRMLRGFCEDTAKKDVAGRIAIGDKECIEMVLNGDFEHYMKYAAHVKKNGHEWM